MQDLEHSSTSTECFLKLQKMIQYSAREWCLAMTRIETLYLTNFRAATAISLVLSLLTVVLVVYDHFSVMGHPVSGLGIPVGPYATFTSVLGFLLSFRTSQVYSRFWTGAGAVHEIAESTFLAASNVVAFMDYGSLAQEQVATFRQTLIRLLSLLCSTMLQDLTGLDAGVSCGIVALDLESMSAARLRALDGERNNKPQVVFQWIKILVIESMSNRVLTVPPPILARVFQDLDNCMSKYHTAKRISQVPFPFPYAATMELILIMHALCTPVVMINLLPTSVFLPVVFVALISFFLWSIHIVAGDLENPFDAGANDLDLHVLQAELNEQLVTISGVYSDDVPFLNISAQAASSVVSRHHRAGPQRSNKRTALQRIIEASGLRSADRSWCPAESDDSISRVVTLKSTTESIPEESGWDQSAPCARPRGRATLAGCSRTLVASPSKRSLFSGVSSRAYGTGDNSISPVPPEDVDPDLPEDSAAREPELQTPDTSSVQRAVGAETGKSHCDIVPFVQGRLASGFLTASKTKLAAAPAENGGAPDVFAGSLTFSLGSDDEEVPPHGSLADDPVATDSNV